MLALVGAFAIFGIAIMYGPPEPKNQPKTWQVHVTGAPKPFNVVGSWSTDGSCQVLHGTTQDARFCVPLVAIEVTPAMLAAPAAPNAPPAATVGK